MVIESQRIKLMRSRVVKHGNILQYTRFSVTDQSGDFITINIWPDGEAAIIDINEEAAVKLDKSDLKALRNMLNELEI
jgi:hypothetical protein